jgi:hypothetical protein
MSLAYQYNVLFLKAISATGKKTITSNCELAFSGAQRLEIE